MSKIYANKNVKRNKKPLQNIVYKIEVHVYDNAELSFILYWQYEKRLNQSSNCWNLHGVVSKEFIRSKLSKKQYSKFAQGQRIFTIQRRKDGKNL